MAIYDTVLAVGMDKATKETFKRHAKKDGSDMREISLFLIGQYLTGKIKFPRAD